MSDAVCAQPLCRKPFARQRPEQRFCSLNCVHMTNGLHVLRSFVCPCGRSFESRKPAARYCSNRCRLALGPYGKAGAPNVAPRAAAYLGRY